MRALRIVGGAERLAAQLGCDAGPLARWVAGEETTPAAIYLKVLDLVSRGTPQPSRKAR